MIRPLVLTAFLVATALAGCLAPSESLEDTASPSATSTSGTNSTTPATSSSGGNNSTPAANAEPTANLTSDVANGSAPLSVTFALSGADADGDALSWTLDLDGDGAADEEGDALPATVNHTYEEVGNYTVTLTVSDAAASASANLTIVVEAAAPPPAEADPWVERDAAGVCHAKDAVEAGPLYLHDRPADGSPNGLYDGGGTWVYEESNGIDGLQVGGAGEDAPYRDCVTPDTLIF